MAPSWVIQVLDEFKERPLGPPWVAKGVRSGRITLGLYEGGSGPKPGGRSALPQLPICPTETLTNGGNNLVHPFLDRH
jgi:hypothetical protein